MSKKLCLVLSVILTATMLLAVCAPTATALSAGSSIKVGLVTDTGGVNDKGFNQLAWEGIQKAAKDLGFQVKFIESKQPTDYEKHIDPEVKDALISSAMKNVDVAVYNYLKTVADDSVKAGISTATLQNGGVSLAPFHDWDSKIPADLKAQIQKASDGIKDGSIKTQ